MRILCIIDMHGNKRKLHKVLDKENDSDLIVMGGDITHLGGYKEVEKIIDPLLQTNARILAVHGNMDRNGVLKYLEEKDISIHGKSVLFDNVFFFGLGGSNPTPMLTPNEYTDAEGKLFLKDPLSKIAGAGKKVFISHAPPLHTKLDIIRSNIHVGSGLVREIIEKYSIDLCVCGHIHEAPGIDNIGKSVCINPGPLRDGFYAVIDITDSGINVKRRNI